MNPSIDSILRDRVQGDVSGVGDLGFAEAHQGFNLAAIHQPDAVVHAATAEDVNAAVRVAAEQGAQVRVQATGHGIGIPMTEGILVNTSALHEVRVDPVKRTATVGAGTQWQQVIDAAAPHGWATLCGSSPTVGVVGYTLGGGMGPMARTFGFASDRVRRLTMVDSSGNVLQIDPVSEPELFWALRGGKPDIGIVTELEFYLIDAASYYGGSIFYPGSQAATVLHEFSRWAPLLPESVSTSVVLLRLPDIPGVPEPLRGQTSVQLRFVHIGDLASGVSLLAPMRAVVTPMIDLVDMTPSAAIASVHQDPTEPMPARDDAMILSDFPAEAVDALLAVAGPEVESPLVMVEVRLMGGALARPGKYESAVGGRHGKFNLCVIGPYPPPLIDAVDASTRAVLEALRPWSAGATLINGSSHLRV